jgi:RND family efflux transporter MFP subunit
METLIEKAQTGVSPGTPRTWQAVLLVALALAALVLAGCGRAKPALHENKLPEVRAALPEERFVGDAEEFTGRLDAADMVEVRSRVTGYLQKVHFTDGQVVKKGDPLFDIDDSTFTAEVDRARANLNQAEARLARLITDAGRARRLLSSRSISTEQADKIISDHREAEATVGAARAALRMAEINLAYCKIAAPLDGRISRRFIDEGNLVRANETALTTIVRLSPIYASFDVDERTVLRLRRLAVDGKVGSVSEPEAKVDVALADGNGFKDAFKGTLNFQDNRIDAGTGTLRVRVEMDNPQSERGDYLLSPGMFVRVRFPVGQPRRSRVVPEEALQSDQGARFLYVLKDSGQEIYLHNDTRESRELARPGEKPSDAQVDAAWVKENVDGPRHWLKKVDEEKNVTYINALTGEVKKAEQVDEDWVAENVQVWLRKKVYVAEYRPLDPGPQDDQMRVVLAPAKSGKQPRSKVQGTPKARKGQWAVGKDELVILSGHQRVKAGGKVILAEEPKRLGERDLTARAQATTRP